MSMKLEQRKELLNAQCLWNNNAAVVKGDDGATALLFDPDMRFNGVNHVQVVKVTLVNSKGQVADGEFVLEELIAHLESLRK